MATFGNTRCNRPARTAALAQAPTRQPLKVSLGLLTHFFFHVRAHNAEQQRKATEAPLQVLRATLGTSRADGQGHTHTLSDEVERVHDHLALMASRMGPGLQVQLDVPDELKSQPVLSLLLPRVDNTIRHGLEPQIDGDAIALQ